MKQHCTATTAAERPCLAWAVRGSQPPLCAAHGGGKQPVGAPRGNRNAVTHGNYAQPITAPQTIDEIITDLAAKQAAISQYLDTLLLQPTDIENLARMLAIHGQNASRLGRLLRDQRALSGKAADGISGAIAQALDELSTELHVEL